MGAAAGKQLEALQLDMAKVMERVATARADSGPPLVALGLRPGGARSEEFRTLGRNVLKRLAARLCNIQVLFGPVISVMRNRAQKKQFKA